MSPAFNDRHHNYGWVIFIITIAMFALVSSFISTYFPSQAAQEKLEKEQKILIAECKKLADTVIKFNVLVSKHEFALMRTANKAKQARVDFFKKPSLKEKAAAYFDLKDNLVIIVKGLEDNSFAKKDARWDEVIVDMRNITNRVGKIQVGYNLLVDDYNKTLQGKSKKYWVKILEMQPADYFAPATNNKNSKSTSSKL